MFTLRLLGAATLESPTGPIPGRASQRHRLALLALLGTHRPGLSRDKLLAYLWPESPPDRARNSLNESIYVVRQALGESALLTLGEDLRLNTDDVTIDVAAFEEAIERRDWDDALKWYRGPFLDGFFVSGAIEFERWADVERKRLASLHRTALEARAGAAAATGDVIGAVRWWQQLATLDPYDARIATLLMEALVAAGNRAAALQHARTHASLVAAEFGLAPDPRVEALAERIRQAPTGAPVPVTAAARAPPTGAPPAGRAVAPSRRRWHVPVALLAVGAAALLVVAGVSGGLDRWIGRRGGALPVVVMMDSPHASRVYDEEVVRASGTNSDVLNDLLRDLPIVRVKEAAGPLWHRHEEIRQLDPDLILIHLSAFCLERCEPHRIKLRAFIEYLADTKVQILVYSRMEPDTLAESYRDMLGDLPQRFPGLAGRLHTFSLVAHGTPHWKDPATAAALKLRVKDLLDLE